MLIWNYRHSIILSTWSSGLTFNRQLLLQRIYYGPGMNLIMGPISHFDREAGRCFGWRRRSFGVVRKNLWSNQRTRWTGNRDSDGAPGICLFRATEKVFSSFGDGWWETKKIYKLDNSKFPLLSSLAKAGLGERYYRCNPDASLHFDHCGGSVFGNGWRKTFTHFRRRSIAPEGEYLGKKTDRVVQAIENDWEPLAAGRECLKVGWTRRNFSRDSSSYL